MLILQACGGGSGASLPASVPASRTLVLGPATTTVYQGARWQFGPTILTGGVRSTVATSLIEWRVQEGMAGGSISDTGLYTAPNAAGTYHVVGTLRDDSRLSATVTINVPPVTLRIYPPNDVLRRGGTRDFFADVNSGDRAVDWSLVEGQTAGSVNAGVYTAASTPGTYHVVARYRADPTLQASATVTVVDSGFRQFATAMQDRRFEHTATLLASGKILSAGGNGCAEEDFSCGSRSAALFDPVSSELTSTSGMLEPRVYHTATRLLDGRVLLVGGGSALAEVYDPATGNFTATGMAVVSRRDHTATLLADGLVLIAGGSSAGNVEVLSAAELYDTQSGSFLPLPNMTARRAGHTATRLPSGQVLIVGGISGFGASSLASAELFDPQSRAFRAAANPGARNRGHSATLLPDGTVLIAGGGATSTGALVEVASVEAYEPSNDRFVSRGTLLGPRSHHAAALQPDGSVLLIGGSSQLPSGSVSVERFDPGSGRSVQVGSLRDGIWNTPAVVLSDGRVVVTGGRSVEIYP